jgi:hypothetical protein
MNLGFGTLPAQSHSRITKKPVDEFGLILQREDSGRPAVNIPRVVVKHDVTGFDFGDHKTKSKELAINALHHCMKAAGYRGRVAVYQGRAYYEAHRHHDAFGRCFIYPAPERGKVVAWREIFFWLKQRGLIGKGGN